MLAAYHMRSDEESGPNAYYSRLASLLGCELVAGHPRGFDPVDFGNLWDVLSSWLERNYDLSCPTFSGQGIAVNSCGFLPI